MNDFCQCSFGISNKDSGGKCIQADARSNRRLHLSLEWIEYYKVNEYLKNVKYVFSLEGLKSMMKLCLRTFVCYLRTNK